MRVRGTGLWAALAVVLCVAVQGAAAAGPLFAEVAGLPGGAEALGIQGVARYRLVEVNLAALGRAGGDGTFAPAASLVLNLFDDVVLEASLGRLEPIQNGGWWWLGEVESPGGGSVILAFDEDSLSGTVTAGATVFQIRSDGGPVHLVRQLSASQSAQVAALAYAPAAGSSLEMQVFHLVNQERGTRGLYLYAWNDTLAGAARAHSLDMGQRAFFDHVNPDGQAPGDRITAAGYIWSAQGENIAAGQTSAAQVMEGWMNSPGHRRNILRNVDDPDGVYYCDLGVGYAEVSGSPYRYYWTQNFGKLRGVTTCPPVDPEGPVLSVSPTSRSVSASAGTTTFSVSNTGCCTLSWTASVTAGGSWLQITSGASGTNSGTLNVSFTANTSPSSRTGTITVSASGAGGSPATVNVVQAGATSSANRPPTVSLAYTPANPTTADTVVFTATASDPDGDPLTYRWYLNGTEQTSVSQGASVVRWSSPSAGSHTMRVVVSDGRGGSDEANVSFTVRTAGSQPPEDPNSHTYGSAAGWYLISVPIAARPGSGMTIWWWNPARRQYERPTTLYPQMGYWARLGASTRLSIPGSPPTSDVTLTLGATGWQQIGAPWPYAKSAIVVVRGGQAKSWADAVSAGWVSNTVYGYKATDRNYTTATVLHPWYGYWLQAKVSGLTLRFVYRSRIVSQLSAEGETHLAAFEPAELPPFPPGPALPEGLTVACSPNPIGWDGTLSFHVVGALALEAAAIEVRVMDVGGSAVWRGTADGAELNWNVTGFDGKPIANGVYTYVADVLVDGQWLTSSVERMLVLR